MTSEIVAQYIKSGLGIPAESKQFRKIAVGPLLMAVSFGIGPGVILRNFWLVLLFFMLFSCLALMVAVFVLSKKELTVKNRLVMQAIIYSDWVLQVILIQTMYYIMAYGFGFSLILIWIAPVLTPLLLGIRNARRIRSDRIGRIKSTRNNLLLSFGCTGMVGVSLAKHFFQGATQEQAVCIVMVLLTFLSCLMSIGLLSYQRLFYLNKIGNID